MGKFRLAVAAAIVAVVGIAAWASTAGAYTCTTNCNTYGNQTSCQRTCF